MADGVLYRKGYCQMNHLTYDKSFSTISRFLKIDVVIILVLVPRLTYLIKVLGFRRTRGIEE
jgi:hypothetical protein